VILVALATWSAETPSFLRALALRAALVKRTLYSLEILGGNPPRRAAQDLHSNWHGRKLAARLRPTKLVKAAAQA
jgi:hypothetical protein